MSTPTPTVEKELEAVAIALRKVKRRAELDRGEKQLLVAKAEACLENAKADLKHAVRRWEKMKDLTILRPGKRKKAAPKAPEPKRARPVPCTPEEVTDLKKIWTELDKRNLGSQEYYQELCKQFGRQRKPVTIRRKAKKKLIPSSCN